jgi:hypothetical protein
VNVVALQNSARKIGLIRGSTLQPPDRRLLVSKRLEERERKVLRVVRLLCESGNSFFDFNSIHGNLSKDLCGANRVER